MSSVTNAREPEAPQWAILELMGHIRTAGLVWEEEKFGAKLGRCDVPKSDGGFTTFYFGGSALFRMTPCTEEAARAVAKGNEPRPVHEWEMPREPRESSRALSCEPYAGYEGEEDEDDPDREM